MRVGKTILQIASPLVLLFAYLIWSQIYYIRGIQPAGIATVADYFHRFGEPSSVAVLEYNGATCFRVVGNFPTTPFYVLALPSSHPVYLFDESGHYVNWCSDPGEINYPWPEGGVVKERIDLSRFKKKFGIDPTSNASTTHQ